jgi:hypothetical protein
LVSFWGVGGCLQGMFANFWVVLVGEHTSYTHAWIFSALESAVRGTTQLLLDMGLVDEAKEITEFWMARWIHM